MMNIRTLLFVTWDCVMHLPPSMALITYSSDTCNVSHMFILLVISQAVFINNKLKPK